jgi:putative signal transducing protein
MNAVHLSDQVVCLTTAPNPLQAHIWENVLRAEGIHSQVVGDYLDSGIGDISGVQAEIWVKRQDMVQAKRILQRCSQSEVEELGENATPRDVDSLFPVAESESGGETC